MPKHFVADIVHRCRNQGGTDVTFCDSKTQLDTSIEVDLVCGDERPMYRYCHITALNDPANGPHYQFNNYQWFTKATANAICEDLGASLPQIKKNLDSVYLKKVIKYLSDFIVIETPYSLKWVTWPVCMVLYIQLVGMNI